MSLVSRFLLPCNTSFGFLALQGLCKDRVDFLFFLPHGLHAHVFSQLLLLALESYNHSILPTGEKVVLFESRPSMCQGHLLQPVLETHGTSLLVHSPQQGFWPPLHSCCNNCWDTVSSALPIGYVGPAKQELQWVLGSP